MSNFLSVTTSFILKKIGFGNNSYITQNAVRKQTIKKSNNAAFANMNKVDKRFFVRNFRVGGAAPSASNWNSVCWSAELRMFVAISTSSTATMKSYDGINWTASGAAPSASSWASVCWSAELGMFAAISISSTATMKSYDGINWTASGVAPSAVNWQSVCWSPELGMFVAAAYGSTDTMRSISLKEF